MDVWMSVLSYLEGLNVFSVSLRILLAMICGGVIGVERGKARQPAGMRTYMLVCMGAAVVMLTGQYMFNKFGTGDPARLGAQVISGIGFLGAGSIITSGNTKIRGLTTAAGLWTAACIGLGIGIGFYSGGIIATLAVHLTLTQAKRLEQHLVFQERWVSLYLEMDGKQKMSDVAHKMEEFGLEVGEVQMGRVRKGFQEMAISVKNTEWKSREEIRRQVEEISGVRFVKLTSNL